MTDCFQREAFLAQLGHLFSVHHRRQGLRLVVLAEARLRKLVERPSLKRVEHAALVALVADRLDVQRFSIIVMDVLVGRLSATSASLLARRGQPALLDGLGQEARGVNGPDRLVLHFVDVRVAADRSLYPMAATM